MKECDFTAPWYHGSPKELTILRKGSWTTQFEQLAKAFSHKPTLISLGGDCVHVKHNGRLPGFLYTVDEPVGPEDVTYLSDTAGTHWQTNRNLKLKVTAKLPLDDPPQLSRQDIAEMQEDIPPGTSGFIGSPDNH